MVVDTTHASPVVGFNAGHIIDDSVFTNNTSMNVSQIQTFLNSKVPSCDTNGTQPASDFGRPDLTHAQYAALVGWPAPPYPCLKDYTENGLGSAQIIYNVAQKYQINPQVLIVLLQKEQGLVTDSWPLPSQYRTATGYGCPDTAACDSQYFGLTNQLTWSGTMFHAIIVNNPNWYTPYILGNNYIQYNPNTSCGGTTVNIVNRSTQALYNYTPYQPNQSALNAGYGIGDSCGAYGNRNFFLYFTDWFGSTIGPGYAFAGATNPPSTLLPNQVYSVQVSLVNQSGVTWYSDGNVPNGEHPTRLGMLGYTDSPFANTADPAWLGTKNQIRMDQSSVANGQIATFTATLRGPLQAVNNYAMSFAPVLDGVHFYASIGMSWGVNTPSPNYSYSVVSQTPVPATLPTDLATSVSYQIKNTGNVVWYTENNHPTGAAAMRLYTLNPSYSASPFYDSATWLANNQIGLQGNPINPGDTANFQFSIRAPGTPGQQTTSFGLVLDGATPLPPSVPLTITSESQAYLFSVTSTDIPSQMIPGQRYVAKIQLKNTGSATWYSDGNTPVGVSPVRLMMSGYRNNPLAESTDPAWLGTKNQVKLAGISVAPGAIGEFDIPFVASYDSSVSFTELRFALDGVYFSSPFVGKDITIAPKNYSYTTVVGTINPPGVMSRGQIATGKLMIKNNSNTIWYADGNTPGVFHGGAARVLMYNPWYRQSRFANPSDPNWLGTTNQIRMQTPSVNPGQVGEFDFTWKAPDTAGIYTEQFSLAIDGYDLIPYQGMSFTTTVQ